MGPGRLGHVPALDGVRGLAIAGVLAYHAYDVPGGFLGVDLFFVLSGFLITTLLLEERVDRGRISFRDFYRRRARRLLPVAFAGIVCAEIVLLGGSVVGSEPGTQLLAGLFSAFYVENLAHYLDPPVIAGLGHYWSLSQEEQFYFLWPPVLAVLLRFRVRGAWLAAGLGIVVVAIIVHRAMLADAGWWRTYYAPDTRSDGILLGCLVAVAWKSGLLRASRLWWLAGPLALAVFGFAAATIDHTTPASAQYGITVANVAGAVIIAGIALAPRAPLSRLLSITPLRWLGLISYSLYIWGALAGWLTQAHGTTLVVISVVVAFLSYRYVERPWRRRAPAPDRPVEHASPSTAAPVPAVRAGEAPA